MTFQRARSEEQRQIRRCAILDTAAAMLDEMPVADVSLNELSRRVGLAKSNVLRYFESREAVLLELLDDRLGVWLADLEGELAEGVEVDAPPEARATLLADVLSRSLAARPVLCDLFGAQGGVLEHNVSVEVVKRHKRASLAHLGTMAGLLRRVVPELGDDAVRFGLLTLVTAGAVSSYVPPPPSLLAAFEEEPELAIFHLDLREGLQAALTAGLLGFLPRD
ncbi:TetR/AcrR family transcriptional regulator [Cellulomonas dongxiuzhuiae]|uniref:TetR/AcrR family transcriptional regulator n=1 Tax=Cellulomonas dongxiuzhuiae TaxID=2819979 RepID=A0ABX8GJD0_9CELL|nr:TetR/AcrR family transcriptional regulator [Cellulomonas dongxiuzhuiae]MBO3095029.1 TetR family transcriptional regulator [Cellulomonas dongxiuzhuiae]QWC16045.1 TetR/AcrR family transcriptional regulator [Cellulomonas dongxiuzhuiae]